MAQEKIRVGVVGLGRSGWDIHVHHLRKLPDLFQIVAVSDPDKARQTQARDEFKCKTYDTLEEFLKDPAIELAVIATPSHFHAANSIAALQAGKAVVCEKPMATTFAEADSIIETAKKTGKPFTVFQNYRYYPFFQKIQKIIASGVLGRIVEVKIAWHGFGRRWDWQTQKKFGGGTLRNTCPHAIDMALLLFGPGQPEVFCHLDKVLTLGDAEDHVKLILKGPNAPTIDIEVTAACAYGQEPWLIMGQRGTLAGDNSKLRWKYYKPEELPKRELDLKPTPDRSYNSDQIKFYEETWSESDDKSLGHTQYYVDVYDSLRNNKPFAVTPEHVRRQMCIIEKCFQLSPV